MALQQGDRVALSKAPEWTGTIADIDRRGCAEIDFDGGGRGRFPEADLVKSDKAWPPADLETK